MKRSSLARNTRALFLLALAAAASVSPVFAAEPAKATANTHSSPGTATPLSDADKLARGKYLVTIAGCNDCHTPWKEGPAGPEPDMSRMLSGHPESLVITAPATPPAGPWLVSIAPTNTSFSGPWGVSFTANLTPDKETGLGKWNQKTFMQTIRTGRHMGRGREILPPMPIRFYKNFTDEDLGAIFTYLQSIPAIKNQVPDPLPPAAPPAPAAPTPPQSGG